MVEAETHLLTGFQALIEREVDRRVRPLEEAIQSLRATGPQLDDATAALIREQMLLASKSYLTRKEAAVYLNVSERSISDWAARPTNENPFPMAYAGGEPRVKRERIDEWADRASATEVETRRLDDIEDCTADGTLDDEADGTLRSPG